MLNPQRLQNYGGFDGSIDDRPFTWGVTPAQLRRLKHKQFSRKTHAHPWGDPCERCKPGWIPARERAAQ